MGSNPFSTSSGFGFASGSPVWGVAASSDPELSAAPAAAPLKLTVRVPSHLGAGRSTVDVSIRADATVADLLSDLRARLAPPAEVAAQLKLLCAGRVLNTDPARLLKDVAGEGVLHLIATGGGATVASPPAYTDPSSNLIGGRSPAVSAAAAAAMGRAAASSIASISGSIKIRFPSREVMVPFEPSMTAKRLKGESKSIHLSID